MMPVSMPSLCSEVLEHVPNPIDAIRELDKLLKTGDFYYNVAV